MSSHTDLRGISGYRSLAYLLFDPLAATRWVAETHGNSVWMQRALFGGRRPPLIHLVGAGYAEEVFRNYEVFENGGIIIKGYRGSYHNHLRKGYFAANGDEYEHYVRLLGPFFRKKMVEAAHPLISRIVREELDSWPTGATIDVIPRFNRLVKRLALQCLHKDTATGAGLHAADMVERHARLSGPTLVNAVSAKLPLPLRLHREARATYDAIVDWGRTRAGRSPDADVWSAIVNAPTEKGCPASPERIAGYGWTMLGAAYDTSTSILSWLLVFLSSNPAVARRLHEEVTNAGLEPETDLTAVMELPYLDAVIKEALRLIPPAPIQRRKAARDTELGGEAVPAGSQILVSAWMTNRDEALYPDSERFDPGRWEGLARSPYQWLTFSAGPRRCIGIWFALAFLKAIAASLMLRWRPEIPDGTAIDMKLAVTVRPLPAVPVVLHPADGNFRASRITGSVHNYVRLN